MQKSTEIDFVRFFLIIAVVLVHIVYFGTVHPEIKESTLAVLMPTFLVITGYLVNVRKSVTQYALYLIRIFIPYAIMVAGFSVLSRYMPVRDGLTKLSLKAVLGKIFITSIGPYWFLQTMIVCGICYYACFRPLNDRLGKVSWLAVFALTLILMALFAPVVSIKAVPYYFIGVVLRQTDVRFASFFRKSPYVILPMLAVLCRKELHDWGYISILMAVYCRISFLLWVNGFACRTKSYKRMLYVGANTLPIYLFHPVFTMAAKYYQPLFGFDRTGILHALATIAIAIVGSIIIARIMDLTRLSYVFCKPRILR